MSASSSAATTESSGRTMTVTVPPGGGTFHVTTPRGRAIEIITPPDVQPGAVLDVEVPPIYLGELAPPVLLGFTFDVPATKIAWECETDTGWSEYGADIAAQLESAFGARAAVSWDHRGFSYSIDWGRMQQVNEKTGSRRGIRRSAAGALSPDESRC